MCLACKNLLHAVCHFHRNAPHSQGACLRNVVSHDSFWQLRRKIALLRCFIWCLCCIPCISASCFPLTVFPLGCATLEPQEPLMNQRIQIFLYMSLVHLVMQDRQQVSHNLNDSVILMPNLADLNKSWLWSLTVQNSREKSFNKRDFVKQHTFTKAPFKYFIHLSSIKHSKRCTKQYTCCMKREWLFSYSPIKVPLRWMTLYILSDRPTHSGKFTF